MRLDQLSASVELQPITPCAIFLGTTALCLAALTTRRRGVDNLFFEQLDTAERYL
jgi:hypothetical protein